MKVTPRNWFRFGVDRIGIEVIASAYRQTVQVPWMFVPGSIETWPKYQAQKYAYLEYDPAGTPTIALWPRS